MGKVMKLQDAVALIEDGSVLAIGGNVLHRAPMALVREIARQEKKGLKLVKTAGAMDVDLLCFAGCVASVDAGFISYESKYSLANHYRYAVQNGDVQAHEHACYTVISALRAAQAGIPFMPVKGLMVSDLITQNDYFTKITDPFSGQEVTVVRAIVPDVCILHVEEADELGNAVVTPPLFEDILMAKASRKVIVTAEKIVPTSRIRRENERVLLPHFLVSAVASTEQGAAPCSCYPLYDINRRDIERFKALKTQEELGEWLKSYEYADRVSREVY
ncbi:CoA transferase subunit A [Christensenella timonensis]|uniref:CoA transferase subunit A n=1 Tax=Christensenella timonensis TaxID=1816678 RepID=UPI00082F0A0F|nr:CoA-transferase [Christensenella timonensis]